MSDTSCSGACNCGDEDSRSSAALGSPTLRGSCSLKDFTSGLSVAGGGACGWTLLSVLLVAGTSIQNLISGWFMDSLPSMGSGVGRSTANNPLNEIVHSKKATRDLPLT